VVRENVGRISAARNSLLKKKIQGETAKRRMDSNIGMIAQIEFKLISNYDI
jgi:hypothetical protein